MEFDQLITRQRPDLFLPNLDRPPVQWMAFREKTAHEGREGTRRGLLTLANEASKNLFAKLVELLYRKTGPPQHFDQQLHQPRQLLGQALG